MSELSIYELEAEHGEVLPERETLGVHHSFNNTVTAFNHATALQALTFASHNTAVANQTVYVG